MTPRVKFTRQLNNDTTLTQRSNVHCSDCTDTGILVIAVIQTVLGVGYRGEKMLSAVNETLMRPDGVHR